jgi:hypothetical protein
MQSAGLKRAIDGSDRFPNLLIGHLAVTCGGLSRACDRRVFRIVPLTCMARSLDEVLERGIGSGTFQARDGQLDMHRRLEGPVADPGRRRPRGRGRHQRQAQSGRGEAACRSPAPPAARRRRP